MNLLPMKFFLIVHPGLEALAQQELQELVGVSSRVGHSFVECSLTPEQALYILQHGQSFQRLLISLGTFPSAENILFPQNVVGLSSWKKILPLTISYSIDLEHIQGQELRQGLLKKMQHSFTQVVREAGLPLPVFTYKHPLLLIIVHWTGSEYILGIDLAGAPLQKRRYRVFPHSAGLTGDIAYWLARKSGFSLGKRLLSGFCKDGSVAIEAASYASGKAISQGPFSCQQFPLFQHISLTSVALPAVKNISIEAFDPARPNIIAAQKNAKIAGVYGSLQFHRYALDDLDVKYDQHSFDQAIFQLTTRDEVRLNEIFYQSRHLLPPQGSLLLLTRKQLDISPPEDFVLHSQEDLRRGDSVHQVWVFRRRKE